MENGDDGFPSTTVPLQKRQANMLNLSNVQYGFSLFFRLWQQKRKTGNTFI